ncbi:MAG: PAC2 family protein [Actinomycetota bacterium]|nr:PAC2 family protein [Actinomycetota bacterium]
MARYERHDATVPARPVLVIALEGWIDAGFAAASAAAALLASVPTEPYVTFDPDGLIDYRSRRPRLRIDDGVRGPIVYAEPQLLVGSTPGGTGVAVLVGPEPDLAWRDFSGDVAALAVELDCRLVIGLGAFPNGVPHTRPVRLAATASDEALARQVGFVPGAIDVPAGIGDVIGAACSQAGIASVGLWARVPHYVAGMPFPPGALALVEGLNALSGLSLDTGELQRSAEATRRRVDELIAASEEHAELVRRLEDQFESFGPGESGIREVGVDEAIPSGDEIAAELERFLRGES